MVLTMGGKHCCVEGCHNNNQKSKSTGSVMWRFKKMRRIRSPMNEGANVLFMLEGPMTVSFLQP